MPRYFPRCAVILKTVFDGFGGTDSEPLIIGERDENLLIPESCGVHLNGYSEADTFEMTFDAKRLPFSPEIIRNCAVQIYMFGVRDGEDRMEPHLDDEENIVLTGLIDEPEFEYTEDGRTVTLGGRDYTALLVDRQWDPYKSGKSGRVQVGKPLDVVVQTLVDQVTRPNETAGFTLEVEFHGDGEKPPLVGDVYYKRTKKKGVPVQAGKTYWDVIYRLVLDHGYICFVQRNSIIISTPQTLTKELADKSVRMAWGRNLLKLGGKRNLTKHAVPQIQMTGVGPGGQVLRAVFPKKPSEAKTGVGTKKNEIEINTSRAVRDLKTLMKMAETRYNSLARGEVEYSFTTYDLKDLDGRDIIKTLKSGRPCRVEFDEYTQTQEFRQLALDQRVRRLEELGFSSDVTRFIARNVEHLNEFRQPFYTRGVDLDWQSGDDPGLSIAATVKNYASEARDDASGTGA